jgi:hypothetical protein
MATKTTEMASKMATKIAYLATLVSITRVVDSKKVVVNWEMSLMV